MVHSKFSDTGPFETVILSFRVHFAVSEENVLFPLSKVTFKFINSSFSIDFNINAVKINLIVFSSGLK